MLLKQDVLDSLLAGQIDTVFRRWRKPAVKAGGQFRYAGHLLATDEVDEIPTITDEDAKRAGFPTALDAIASVPMVDDGLLYRIRLRVIGEDPRIALREIAELSDEERSAIRKKLDRWDGNDSTGPWTGRVLELIRENPGQSSAFLADQLGIDRMVLKVNVRKLKELGLTESLEVGYRLSPRGERFLDSSS